MAKNHYYTTKVVKMGKWAVPINDAESWHGEVTNKYFKQLFGIPKGTLLLYTFSDNYHHAYFPEKYFLQLHKRIETINKKDFKALAKKFSSFYPLVAKARQEVSKDKTYNLANLSNKKLIQVYNHNRQWVQHVAAFDQFTWIGEEYWTPVMRNILENKPSLRYGSEEYNRVLFALTKPEALSTTLLEKRTVIEQVLKLKTKATSLDKAAKYLAVKFGWMPVFTYGTSWEAEHYKAELTSLLGRNLAKLQKDFTELKNYTNSRKKDITNILKTYKLSEKDLQVFVDFGLAIDTRNEAEYFVSFGGFYLIPILKEMAKRLFLSVGQVRNLTQKELIDCLLGKADPHKILEGKRKVSGWGWDKNMKTRVDFSAKEAEKLFNYIESYVKPIQGADEGKGVCASPGIVKGKIRIVPKPEQNNRVKNGDILVTYATTTDYLPAMKRAAGIITEVGGLTCHAAVVSREFGIPCIVALANAMKNLKDGDLVELNANEGTVKKL